tara:strand:+ start:883 stop:1536 length:654 start_codon:yes stop_codon:yes gene_type:complete
LNKETSHRSHELKQLGWNQEDITRYEELWEYSQRWGLINLEKEDRQFLRKAEKLLPKIQPKKISNKKSIEEKSYYLWLNFYFEKIKNFRISILEIPIQSVWEILIEEELKLLDIHKPTMGLPDSLKGRELVKIRKNLIKLSFDIFKAKNSDKLFDFDIVTNPNEQKISKTWKSIIASAPEEMNFFPLMPEEYIEKFRCQVKDNIEEFMVNNYPSLKK